MVPAARRAATAAAGAGAAEAPFSFVALGDTAYAAPADFPLYEKLIATINAAAPAFSIHVGDTKGRGDCGRAVQERQRAFFDTFAAPVIYTPGNNEWADCWKANRGSADPLEIRKVMREVFWGKPESMGKVRLPLVRQADADPAFPEVVENARWRHGGATFATLDLAGTYNNQELRVEPRGGTSSAASRRTWPGSRAPSPPRGRAGTARVLAFHPNPFDEKLRYENGPFEPLVRRSRPRPTPSPGRCSSCRALP